MDAVFDEAPSKINKATEAQNQFSKAVENTTEKIKSLKEQISEYFKEAKKAQNTEREAFIKGKELDVLKLRAQGEKKAADELENKIESMKKAIEIADKYGISLRKAANLVENINRAEARGGTTDQKTTVAGQTVEQAKAESRKKGIRFQKFMGPGGTSFQQRFIDGKKAGRFSDKQLADAAANRPQSKDPAQELAAQTKALEAIERELTTTTR